MGCCNVDKVKEKCFVNVTAKDVVKRVRTKDDYELDSIPNDGTFPTYDPSVVLKSFTERDDKADSSFFKSTWKKLKAGIIGQTIWVICTYLVFYYLVQILFVQSAVDACDWFQGSNRTEELRANDASCAKATFEVLNCEHLGKKACATTFKNFVKSWEGKQTR